MSRLPTLTGRQVVHALERGDFSVVRIKGSHHVVQHGTDPTRRTVVPVHGNQDLGRGLLKQILVDLDLTEVEFLDLL